MTTRTALSTICGLMLACSALACGAPADSNGEDLHVSTTSTGSGSDDGTAGAATTNTSGSGSACTPTTLEAEHAPVDMHLLLDRTASMGSTKLYAFAAAAKSFILAAPQDLTMGLQTYPRGYGCGAFSACPNYPAGDLELYGTCVANECRENTTAPEGACMPEQYAQPNVALGPLSLTGAKIMSATSAALPAGDGALGLALRAATDQAAAWKAAHPTHRMQLVVVKSDALLACTPWTDDDLANIAAAGFASGVHTYVVEAGTIDTLTLKLSTAGGTAYTVAHDQAAFVSALYGIRSAAACTYALPDGADKNPAMLSVTAGGTKVTKVDDRSLCGDSGGFFVSDGSTMELCPTTCKAVEQNQDKVELTYACDGGA